MTGLVLLLLATTPAWEERGVEEGISISTREVEQVEGKEIRAIGRVEAPPAEVFATLIDVPHMTRNRPHTTEARLIERTGTVLRYYQRVDPPVVSARDYVLEGRLSRVGEGGFRLAFRAVPDARVPPREGVVRLELIRGSWTVEPASGGKASTVTYQVLTDGKAALPAFVANRAALTGAKDVFLKLREVVKLPEYRGAKPVLGDEAVAPGGAAPATPASPAAAPGAAAPVTPPQAGPCDAAVERLERLFAALPHGCDDDAGCALYALRAFPCAPEVVLPKSFSVEAAEAAPYRAALAETRAACKERIPGVVTCERVSVKAACRAGRCVDVARGP